jgi:hypothetical protein
LSLYEGETLVHESATEFFYVAGEYTITGITTYPPIISPGSTALFALRLDVPEDADPYIVWRMEDLFLSSGYLSEGSDTFQWEVPDSEGVFSIEADLFPVGPVGSDTFAFPAQQSIHTEIFVTSRLGRNESGFGQVSSYYTLFQFLGNVNDSSPLGKEREVTIVGEPELTVRGGVFGYYLDGVSGFSLQEILLPVQKGNITPCSVNAKFLLDSVSADGNLFSVVSADGAVSLDVAILESGVGALTVSSGVLEGVLDTGDFLFEPDQIYTVTISFFPEADGTAPVIWYVNGKKTAEGALPVSGWSQDGEGVSVIGGAAGITGVIDEFGVFYKDSRDRFSTDPDVFKRAMMEEDGGDLLLAEGFDGTYIPEGLETEGDVDIGSGVLVMGERSSVVFPDFVISYDIVKVKIFTELFPPDSEIGIAFSMPADGEEKSALVTMGSDGIVSLPDGGTISLEGSLSGGFLFDLKHGDEGIFLVTEQGEMVIAPGMFREVRSSISVNNFRSGEPFTLDGILIRRESSRIVSEEEKVTVSEDAKV